MCSHGGGVAALSLLERAQVGREKVKGRREERAWEREREAGHIPRCTLNSLPLFSSLSGSPECVISGHWWKQPKNPECIKYVQIHTYTCVYIHTHTYTFIRASCFPTKLSAPHPVLLSMNTPKWSKPHLEVVWDVSWL